MDKATWQILPPRKKGRRSGKLSADSTIKEESLEGIEARTTQIEKNIAARAENSSSGKNAEATLESWAAMSCRITGSGVVRSSRRV